MPAVPEELLDLAAQVARPLPDDLGAALALVLPPGGSLRLRRVAEPTAAGLAALAAGDEAAAGARALHRRRRARRRRRAPAPARLAGRQLPACTSRASGRHRACSASARASPARLGARQRAALDYMRRRRTVDEADLRKHTRPERPRPRPAARRRPRAAGRRRRAARRRRPKPPPTLLPEQEAALAQILAATGRGEPVLLHGVTGSGKTEVYLRAAEAVLRSRPACSCWCPRSASPADRRPPRARASRASSVAVLHSGPVGAASGSPPGAPRPRAAPGIVLGARSAVFAPHPRPRADRRRRGARHLVQAGERARATTRARWPRWRAAAHRRRRGAGLGHARASRASRACRCTPTCRGASTARSRRALEIVDMRDVTRRASRRSSPRRS